ncbi:translin-associated protein X [Hyalella azteca]|uniref:Translin-associated protein X n=1 Tax=Hyalella azteca TaxID=294128 RepID=A0A8B7PIL5_HYAAZ|nr:translin-associated protein X [Hyalella azteca]
METSEEIENSAILKCFATYSTKLNHSYDKYESIYKMNRDLNRESKKIICTLHRIPGCAVAEQELCLKESEEQLSMVQASLITSIAKLLDGEALHQYSPAHASGIEEYLEALLFYSFLKKNFILSFEQVCCFMNGDVPLSSFFEISSYAAEPPQVLSSSSAKPVSSCTHSAAKMVSFDAYILGLSDVSGELMRYFIKCAGVGEVEKSALVVQCLRQMNAGYGSLQAPAPSLKNKIAVHRRNLAKVEEINYNLNLRRSELPHCGTNILLTDFEDDFV